jgi:hypothetical protein
MAMLFIQASPPMEKGSSGVVSFVDDPLTVFVVDDLIYFGWLGLPPTGIPDVSPE